MKQTKKQKQENGTKKTNRERTKQTKQNKAMIKEGNKETKIYTQKRKG